jgi:hypothetical protein
LHTFLIAIAVPGKSSDPYEFTNDASIAATIVPVASINLMLGFFRFSFRFVLVFKIEGSS